MNYEEFTTLLSGTSLSGREFAKLLKLNPNTIANYKQKGEIPSHLAVIAVLIHQMESHGVEYRAQIEALGLQPNAPRGKSL
ncbi:XRE family transcriptional regulator [Rhodoferax sp. GW822-FHT02A01]|uniref:XRE family transcriptional regulator n=1 Tax=Rhodoferax sp. GW822-FHT02A01 TaxID=3141537 RepID=UPI00315C5767